MCVCIYYLPRSTHISHHHRIIITLFMLYTVVYTVSRTRARCLLYEEYDLDQTFEEIHSVPAGNPNPGKKSSNSSLN